MRRMAVALVILFCSLDLVLSYPQTGGRVHPLMFSDGRRAVSKKPNISVAPDGRRLIADDFPADSFETNNEVDEDSSAARRHKRYSIEGSYWGVKQVSFRVKRSSRSMSEQEVWENHSGLTFVEKLDGPVNIEIVFAEGQHGDGEPFDGEGKILAHAYFPRYGGDVHFDDAEQWSPDKYGDGIDLYAVAVHEIGHSLGLKHSHNHNAIMAPFYQTYTGSALHLHHDDITALQRLYGPAKTKTQPTTKPAERKPDLCRAPHVDAITRLGNGTAFTFQGEYYWRLTEGGLDREGDYPRKIEDDWPGLIAPIDASLSDPQGDTYIFKDDKYWLLDADGKVRQGYPQIVMIGLVDMPPKVDAAFISHTDDKPYFFKKDKYWRYSRRGTPKGYPRSTKAIFKGHPPAKIDAALRWSPTESFLFVGSKYYRLIKPTDSRQPLRIAEGYPKSTAKMWFGCDGEDHLKK